MIDLDKFGKQVEVQQYTIDKIDKKLEQFNFIKNGYDSKYSKIQISTYKNLYANTYYNQLVLTMKNGKEIITEFDTITAYEDLKSYLGYIDFLNQSKDDISLDTLVQSKDNAKTKNEDGFTVEMDISGIKFLMSIPNNCICVKSGNSYTIIDEDTKKKIEEYIILDNTILCVSRDEFGNKCFRFDDITSNMKHTTIQLDNIDKSLEELHRKVPNLHYRSNTVFDNYNRTDIEYSDNIEKEDTSNKSRYEYYPYNDEGDHITTSLHKVYYDLFDYTMNICRSKLWCVETLEEYYDDLYYNRYIYKIEDEEALIKAIEEETDEYAINYQEIDIEMVVES